MRLYKFDKCMSEYQHSKELIAETSALLRTWLIQSQSVDKRTKKFCFLFGSAATNKSEELNLMNNSSII